MRPGASILAQGTLHGLRCERLKGRRVAHLVEIENIDELRRRQGIDDLELRKAIHRLQVGDHVRLTFLIGNSSFSGETLPVRITSIRGKALRGKLATAPALAGLSRLRLGSAVLFCADQIHSIAKRADTPRRKDENVSREKARPS
jgi:hypothetical protein